MLEKHGIIPSQNRTVRRALTAISQKTKESIMHSDQKIEDYFKVLNHNGQYGVILYSNGELVVPDVEEGIHRVKMCTEVAVCSRFQFATGKYWDELPNATPTS